MSLADFDFVEFLVSNASQSAYWYCCCFGFKRFAHKKTENSFSIAVRNGKTIFVFTSYSTFSSENMEKRLRTHGDSVFNVGFRVDDIYSLRERLESCNVKIVRDLWKDDDETGEVECLTIEAFETDLLHTLVDRKNFFGTFLPHYESCENFNLLQNLRSVSVISTDHVVQNYPSDSTINAEKWYENTLKLHRFWSIDDKVVKSEDATIKAHLLTNPDQKVQMTLVESAKKNATDQISEFLYFNGGSGVQHIALLVDDIIETIEIMRERSVEFLSVPAVYYEMLGDRLKLSKVNVQESLEKIKELSILVDFDDSGYLLQIFTKPCQDRPTLFIELIQRHNFNGFGAGNVKALFDAVEREQEINREKQSNVDDTCL